MKTKKIFIVVLAVVLMLSLAACGQKDDAGSGAEAEAEVAETGTGIDLKGSGRQTVSDERATEEQLQAALDWQESLGDDKFKLTYEDYKQQIGCDASEYEWNAASNYGVYYWFASDDDTVSLNPVFKDGDGTLFAGGSNGLSF